MYQRKCKNPQCRKTFFTNSRNQQYCGKECIIDHQKAKKKVKKNHRLDPGTGQKCWICGNACAGCSWSRDGIPIEGWVAKRSTVKYRGELEYYSYKIIHCPLFWQDVEVIGSKGRY